MTSPTLIVGTLLTVIASNAPPQATNTVARYDLAVTLIPETKRMVLTGTVILPAAASVRTTVVFSLRKDMARPAITVLEPAPDAGPVRLRALGDEPGFQVSQRWEMTPARPIPAGVLVRLRVSYAGGSETKGEGFFNVGPEGSFASGWNSAWYPVFGNKRGSGVLRFNVPKGWVVKASGRQVDAATFSADQPSVFGFAAGPYAVVRRREGRVPITLYLFKENPRVGEMLLNASRAVEVLEEEFGPYPFAEFAIVETPSEPSQAAGFLGAALEGFFIARTDYLEGSSFDLGLIAHEMSHQWWPYLVEQEGGATDLMLTEALAHYGSLRAVDAVEGSAAAERHRRGDGAAIRLMATGVDYPLGALPDEGGSYSLSNTKGYVIYDLLARTIGRDKFRTALHSVTSKHAFGKITWSEFLQEIQRSAGQDLGWFYQQWFERPGAPSLSITWTQAADSLKYRVIQTGSAYRLQLPVQIELADGSSVMQDTHVDGDTTDIALRLPARMHAVRLDPHFEVFHTTPAEKAEAEALRYFTQGNRLWNSGQTDQALTIFRDGLRHLPEVDGYGAECLLRLHIGWIHQEAGRLEEARVEYEGALAQAVRPAAYLARLYLNLATVAQAQGDRQRVTWAAQRVLATELALGQDTGRSRQARRLLSDATR